MAVDNARLQALGRALDSKGANKPCSRCGHTQFSVIDETLLSLQPLEGNFIVGGGGIPTVIVACNNCGNLLHHALAPLNMIPDHLKDRIR